MFKKNSLKRFRTEELKSLKSKELRVFSVQLMEQSIICVIGIGDRLTKMNGCQLGCSLKGNIMELERECAFLSQLSSQGSGRLKLLMD